MAPAVVAPAFKFFTAFRTGFGGILVFNHIFFFLMLTKNKANPKTTIIPVTHQAQ